MQSIEPQQMGFYVFGLFFGAHGNVILIYTTPVVVKDMQNITLLATLFHNNTLALLLWKAVRSCTRMRSLSSHSEMRHNYMC